MKKSLLIIAAMGMIVSSCSNEAELASSGGNAAVDNDGVVITLDNTTTRETMKSDLVHTWNGSDVMGVFSTYDNAGTLTTNGTANATFTFHDTYTTAQQTFSNVFTQSGTPAVKWQASDKKHNFWMYSPRDENATSTGNVSFTLASAQTQTTANVWSNPATGGYNFIWHNITNAYRPYDRSIPFVAKRLLPVAEFNIVRDDATLDGYYLTGITMTPTATNGTMPTGKTTIDLANLATCTGLTFTGTPVTNYSLTTATSTTDATTGMAVNSVALNKSFSTYMSVPPAASQEYKVVATFGNGTKTKVVTITRSDEFTIAAGKGNIVRYYFKSSKAKDPGDAINDGYGAYNVWTSNPPITNCPSYNEITWYFSAGAYWDDGTGANPQSYTVTNSSNVSTVYHNGLWLMKKQYIDGFTKDSPSKNASGTVITNATQGTGGFHSTQADLGTINKDKYFFLPAAGYYSNATLYNAGTSGNYWSSTPNGANASWNLYFNNGSAYLFNNGRRDYGYSVWAAQ